MTRIIITTMLSATIRISMTRITATSSTTRFRASSHLAGQIERPNLKLLSRGEDRSSLKYIINVLLLDFEYFIEKNFDLSTKVEPPIFMHLREWGSCNEL